jgi:riboflavin kinase/FMN adenylyltransferase
MEIRTLHYDSKIEETRLVLCIGFFDGIHIAHQALIDRAVALGKTLKRKTAMMTFSTQVMAFIKNEQFYFLTSLPEKIKQAEQAGFDYFFIFNVDAALVSLEPEIFIDRFLKTADTVVVGFDFSFGKKGLGTTELLLRHSEFSTIVIAEMKDGKDKIGSTRIRQLLKEGNIPAANRLLGKNFTLIGKVIAGKGRGKILGFPTANIDYDGYFLPKSGVYATLAHLDGKIIRSMTNIGTNPTFGGEKITLETHLFDFDESIYGKMIQLEFKSYMRGEETFPNAFDLVKAMQNDADGVHRYFETEDRE